MRILFNVALRVQREGQSYVRGNRTASEDLSLLDQVASELLLLPPLFCPGAREVYQPLYDTWHTCTQAHANTCSYTHIAQALYQLVHDMLCVQSHHVAIRQ